MCNVQQAEVAPRPGPSVCRRLFGPVDHAQLSRELHSRLREMEEESSRRWDFDFHMGVPLPSSRYVWEESWEDTVPSFYRAPQRLRTASSTLESSGDTQTEPSANRSSTHPSPSANSSTHPSPSASNNSQPAPSAIQWCQAASSTTAQFVPSASTEPNTSTQPAAGASIEPNRTQPAASVSTEPNRTQPAASASTEPNRTHPAPNASPEPSRTHPAPNASTEPSRTQPAPSASSGPCKRSLPVSHITGFFPVKKSKVVKALCDKLHSRSPILTEHTPRKMLR